MPALRQTLARLGLVTPPLPGGSKAERDLGRRGERTAATHLRRAGFRILGRNVLTRIGEADLVALDPDGRTIVIVEVKTRRLAMPSADGRSRPARPPELSITVHKQRKLLAVARYLAKANHWRERPIRIDVIAIDWPAEGKPVLRHYRSASAR